MNPHVLILVLIGLISHTSLFAQREEVQRRLSTLTFSDELPADILSKKVAVLVSIPPKSSEPTIRNSYESIAQVAQKGFQKARIDAVIYYHIEDIMSGPEAYESYLDAFDKRNLSHGAILRKRGSLFELILLKFTDRQFLISEGQQAYKIENASLDRMMELLYRKTANSGLDATNLLIIDTPEYGAPVEVINGKRSEFYDLNFKSEKLAVPMFGDTASIRSVMENYPFKWDIVNSNKTEEEIRKDGYQYVLYYVRSTAKNARIMLGYKVDGNENAFASEVMIDGQPQVQSQNANAVVHKFYIKHIRSRNFFIGRQWDPGYTWEDGLSNYIMNLRNQLLR